MGIPHSKFVSKAAFSVKSAFFTMYFVHRLVIFSNVTYNKSNSD